MTIQTKTAKPQKPAAKLRLVLIGFMGAGKTAAAEALANQLNVAPFDLDEFVEARENRTPAQIIENLGEDIFREIETEALNELLRLEAANIIALGGGTWIKEENRKLIKKAKFRVVWLDAEFELCWQRIKKSGAARPLAANKKQARRLFDERREVYSLAEIHSKIGARSTAEQIAAEIYAQIGKSKPKSKK